MYAPGRCPIAPPHTSLPPCLQRAAAVHPTLACEHSSPPPLRTWQDASSFNQPLDWDVARVTSMYLMFGVRAGRCPIAPPHTSLPPCLQRAASAPHAHLSIPRLLLSAPGRRPPASTSPWTGTSRKSRACATCSRYARACCLPSRHRTRASCLACSPPPLHTARAPEHLSPPSSPHLAVRLQLQPAPGLGRRASHEHGIHVLCTPGPLPHRATAHELLALPAARRRCAPRTPEHSSPRPLRTWQSASSFNQPLDWDVAQVTSMVNMFYVRPGRCPIAPPHASLPPCLQPTASAPHARLSTTRLPPLRPSGSTPTPLPTAKSV